MSGKLCIGVHAGGARGPRQLTTDSHQYRCEWDIFVFREGKVKGVGSIVRTVTTYQ
ncbi:MAG: hypothetical protein QXI97_05240 [Nitrososphaerota archaeon]